MDKVNVRHQTTDDTASKRIGMRFHMSHASRSIYSKERRSIIGYLHCEWLDDAVDHTLFYCPQLDWSVTGRNAEDGWPEHYARRRYRTSCWGTGVGASTNGYGRRDELVLHGGTSALGVRSNGRGNIMGERNSWSTSGNGEDPRT